MFKRALRIFFTALGVIWSVLLLLALTPVPYYMHYNLGKDPNQHHEAQDFFPEYIVMFGGAGMPSESNLIRLYYTAEHALHFHKPVILVHPKDSVCQMQMKRFLVSQGVDEDSVHFMTEGSNTRSQVIAIIDRFPDLADTPILVITAPENMRRTIKCLNKAGFLQAKGSAAREAAVDFNLSLNEQDLKGNESVHTVESTNIRYTFWNYMKLEITCFREYFALSYYKLKGWI